MRVGIYSGTFDPVHRGHIAFALAAQKACVLDKIAILPEANPRKKFNVTPLAHRKAMLHLAIQNHASIELLDLPHTQFSVHSTLPALQKHYAGCDLALLIGSDIVRTFTYRWDGLGNLLQQVELAIGLRTSDTHAEIQSVLDSLGLPLNAAFVDSDQAHIAASTVRGAVSPEGIDPRVASYIAAHKLYAY